MNGGVQAGSGPGVVKVLEQEVGVHVDRYKLSIEHTEH